MATRTWHVQGRTAAHTVSLEHAYASGKATVTVDGQVVYHRPRKWVDFGLKQKLVVDGMECLLRVIPTPWLTFGYHLLINGERDTTVQQSRKGKVFRNTLLFILLAIMHSISLGFYWMLNQFWGIEWEAAWWVQATIFPTLVFVVLAALLCGRFAFLGAPVFLAFSGFMYACWECRFLLGRDFEKNVRASLLMAAFIGIPIGAVFSLVTWYRWYLKTTEQNSEPNKIGAANRCQPSQFPGSPEIQSSDSQRTSSSGGCG